MSSDENKALVRRFVRNVLQEHNADATDELLYDSRSLMRQLRGEGA